MNLISISTDSKILEPGSAVAKRMIEYGSIVDEMHILVFTKRRPANEKDSWPKKLQLSSNVWIYPTHSFSRLFYIFDARRISNRIARRFTPSNTVVSTQDPFETGLVGAYLKKRFGLKFQIQIHTDFLSPYFTAGSWLNRVRVWIARRVLPQADAVRVVSERIKKSLGESHLISNEIPIDVLPIFIASETSQKAPAFTLHEKYPQFSEIIVMCSRLAPEKNIQLALRVLKSLLLDFSRAGLIIVGDGSEKQKLMNTAMSLGVSQSVIFVPWTIDLVPYYATCDIFLSTSLYEGYGLTLIEAGVSSAAVVTSDVGIAGELLFDGKNACICPVGDTPCFIAKIRELLTIPTDRRELGQQLQVDTRSVLISKEQYLRWWKHCLEKALHS